MTPSDPGAAAPADPVALLEELRHVQSVTDGALAHLAVEDLLDELLIRVSEALGTDTTAILLLDREANELVARAAKGIEEEVEQGVRIPLGRGFAGTIAARREPVILEDVDHTNVMNPILREKGIRSLMGVPLLVQGELIGVLHVGSLTPRTFTDSDLRLLQLVADRVAMAIHVGLYERDRIVAETLQRSFLPDRLPAVVGLDFSARYVPSSASGIGGDWYDAFALPNGAIVIAVGDVVGRGVHAASVMGRIRNALRAYAIQQRSPQDLMAELARMLHAFDRDEMATLIYSVFDPTSRQLTLVNAGHLPPVLITPGSGAAFLELPVAPPLGARRGIVLQPVTITLEPGMTLVLYTDGLVERPGLRLEDQLEDLRATLAREPALEDLPAVLLEKIEPGVTPDDVAFLAMRLAVNRTRPHVITIRAQSTELAAVRIALRAWLSEQQLPQELSYDVLIAACEAAANAIEHAYGAERGTIAITLHRSDTTLDVTVHDSGNWRGSRVAGRGRGLSMMDRLTDSMDVNATSEGTTVTLSWKMPTAAAP